jgi:signal transduction histidine kinase
MAAGDNPDGWRLVAGQGGVVFESRSSSALARLHGSLPVAVGALVLGLLAVPSIRYRRRRAEAAASLAGAAAAVPLLLQGEEFSAALGLVFAIGMPVVWLWRWEVHVSAVRLALLVLGLAAAGGTVIARHSVPDLYAQFAELADSVRLSLGVAVVVMALAPAMLTNIRRLGGLRAVDVACVVAAGVVVALVVVLFQAALPIVIAVLLLAVLVYPRWRGAASALIDRLLVADLRERTSLEASEFERARLARDLHDAPLQELSGVIRRIESSEARGEAEPLRRIADQLRTLATDLHPPVLDDLGLVPAIEFIAAERVAEGLPVDLDLINQTGYIRAQRPPEDVEVALFRVVQEALRNAAEHSNATRVRLSGTIAPDRIELEVGDDGIGLSAESLVAASKRGRLGIPSMRRRLAAVGGTLELAGCEPTGLSVKIRWSS